MIELVVKGLRFLHNKHHLFKTTTARKDALRILEVFQRHEYMQDFSLPSNLNSLWAKKRS